MIGASNPVVLISGPCQLESLDHAMLIAEKLSRICTKNKLNVFGAAKKLIYQKILALIQEEWFFNYEK